MPFVGKRVLSLLLAVRYWIINRPATTTASVVTLGCFNPKVSLIQAVAGKVFSNRSIPMPFATLQIKATECPGPRSVAMRVVPIWGMSLMMGQHLPINATVLINYL